MSHFVDWLTVYQDHDENEALPVKSDQAFIPVDTLTGEFGSLRQRPFTFEGSYSTSIQISINGNRIRMSGNPSRYDRLDNLFGLKTVDQCIAVYNNILSRLGLPPFTKCTKVEYLQSPESKKVFAISDGAVITQLHITSNVSVGKGCVDAYLKAISGLNYRNSIPKLHTNGKTVDWLSKAGNARLIYPKVYDKENEIILHSLPKITRRYKENSKEYEYIQNLINYCNNQGVVRFEQELHHEFLRRNNLSFYGLSDYSILQSIHDEFLSIDKKLKVNAMDLQTISESLITEGIVESTKAANTTAMYALNWMNGQVFDKTKSQVKIHRSRLKKIGIDIFRPCNITKFSPVIIKEITEIEKQPTPKPDWYPLHLKLVA